MDYPLYVNVDSAVEISGISERHWRKWLASDDPPPHIKLGVKQLIQRDGIADYLQRKQEVRL